MAQGLGPEFKPQYQEEKGRRRGRRRKGEKEKEEGGEGEEGLGCSSVVEGLPSMCKALSSILSTERRRQRRRKVSPEASGILPGFPASRTVNKINFYSYKVPFLVCCYSNRKWTKTVANCLY
jgi:hypothetical protein